MGLVEIAEVLGEGWIRGTYGSDGQGWKFIEKAHLDNMIFCHNGEGEHVGSYYGISSGATGRIKVVDSDTYIICSEDW